MTSIRTLLARTAVLCAAGLAFLSQPLHAQDQQQIPPAKIALQIAKLHPKTVVFVFDVTMSTKHGGVFTNERAATATILRNGCDPGDRVALIKFGTGATTVFDKTLATREDAVALINQIPSAPEPGRGTNIRLPHNQALQMVQDGSPNPGAIILLTDSFNDQPLESDPNYPKYTAYYTPKLTVYPSTPENADYERLLRTLKASGKLHQYGVGVGIAPNGRPIERLPVGPGESDAPDTSTETASQALGEPVTERKTTDTNLLLFGCFGAVILGLAFGFWAMSKPSAIRLALGDKGMPRDYMVKSGKKVCLGGSLATCGPGDDFFPLTGLDAPAAFVAASGGGFVLNPNSTNPGPAKVFHNGIPLNQTSPLKIGDEIRISVPADDSAVPRDYRIRFADPKAAVF
jgi:hypothetical protein